MAVLTALKKPRAVMRYATKIALEENVRDRGLEVIAQSVQLMHSWVDDVDLEMGWRDPHKSFRLLRGWLHVLRDSLPLSDVGNPSAQLPLIVREPLSSNGIRRRHMCAWTAQHFFNDFTLKCILAI